MLRRPHNIISYLKMKSSTCSELMVLTICRGTSKMDALRDESQKLLRDKVDQVRLESLALDIAERGIAGTLSLH